MANLVTETQQRPWPAPMAGAVLKLWRAQCHLWELSKEIDDFFNLKPYRTALYADEAGLEHVLVAHTTHEPPVALPLIAGDCMQNMRVALDQLAWALARIGGKEPPRNVACPIYLAPDDFHERTKKGRPTAGSGLAKIRTMPAEARRMIEELQPWHAEDPELHPLWTLNEYSRIDRHRTLSIIFALDDYSDAVVGRRSESGKFVHDPDMTANEVLSSGAFYDGAELFRFTLKEPEPNLEVQYESSPLYLSLGKAYETTGVPVVELLGDIHRHIERNVLPSFRKFFEEPVP